MKPNLQLYSAVFLLALTLSASAAVRYVSSVSSSPTAPYTTWATAATNIQDAIDAATDGDQIFVTNGVYATGGRAVYGTMTNRVVIDKAVTVKSVNGPALTFIVGQGVGNPATNGDGAIRCVYLGTNAVLSGFTLTNGHTRAVGYVHYEQSGGGVWCELSGVLTNCILAGNMGYIGGGAFRGFLNNCILTNNWGCNGGGANGSTLNKCNLSGNSSPSGGGAFDSELNNCSLTGNSSSDGGGAWGCSLNNCFLGGNEATSWGGGACNSILTNCTLITNSAKWGGGAFNGTMVNCSLTGNSAVYTGGGAFGYTNCILIGCKLTNNLAEDQGGGGFNAQLSNCILNGNVANQQGGGGYSNTFYNCILIRNSGQRGGAASSSMLNNCTVIGNSASVSGGVDGGALSNCIVYFNTASVDPNYGNCTFSYSCTTPLPTGTGNIDADPLFIDTNQWANLRLQSNSPCVNVGNNAYAPGSTDLDGKPRIVFGTVDIGAYEAQWPFRFVNAANANPQYPYDSWETAATSIQDAIDAAIDGAEIIVADGIYATGGRAVYTTMTNRVAIDKPVTVRSVNGPNVTFIFGQGVGTDGTNNGSGAIRCVYVGTNAVLSGFTLTNGHTRTSRDGIREMSGGGALCESSGIVTNCILTGNSAWYYGGGASSGTLYDCIIRGNNAGTYGGGLYNSTGKNCTITGNSSSYSGGGAYESTLTNCTLTGNSSSSGGGGSFYGTLVNCTLNGNSSGTSGGGSYYSTLYNCTLTGNSTTTYGGGSYYGTLYNCTLTGNSCARLGGGSYAGTLRNCIIYFNDAPSSPNYYNGTITYSCSTPLPSGTGNIDSDPLLASASHLSAQSPCIGAGSYTYASGVDIDGEAWLFPPCMGADQFTPGSAGELSVAITAAYSYVAVGFPAPFVAANTGSISDTVWDFGDGVMVTNSALVTHAWTMTGLYRVRLIGYNADHPEGVIATTQVRVAEQEVAYVNGDNNTPVYPYTSWETAALTIQDACEAGTQIGRLVRVTNGVYATGGKAVYSTVTNRVAVPEGVEVRSENGPLVTIIAGQPTSGTTPMGTGAIRCAYVAHNAILTGFTLTNGYTRNSVDVYKEGCGGGAYCEGTINNCIFTGNYAYQYGAGVYGGTLNNCVLTGNSSLGSGGAAAYSTLNNCTLTCNSAVGSAGGVMSGTLNNCIVYFNFASASLNYTGCTFANSCSTPLPAGSGNISNDPLLASPSHLSAQSPCIGLGNSLYATGVDIDGEPWLTPPCMGADQLTRGAAIGELNVAFTAAYTNVTTYFPISFMANISGSLTNSIWDFGDGVVISNQPYISHTWTVPGVYLVGLTAFNDTYPEGVSNTLFVRVAEPDVYYVAATNTNPTFPYTNWETAATSIQDAIDAGAQLGRVVRVAPGVYASGGRAVYNTMTNRVVLPEWVQVRSEQGPRVTTIVGQSVPTTNGNGEGAIRCAYLSSNSVLSGFTLSNGHTLSSGTSYERYGGGAWCEDVTLITNCIFVGNSAAYAGGAVTGGRLANCTLTDNSAVTYGGAAYDSVLQNCTIIGNSARYGGAAYSSTINNSVLTGNTASYSGGGAYNSYMYNCTIVGNSAGSGGGMSYSSMYNCIAYYNTATNGSNIYNHNSIYYSCTTPLPSGSGNITTPPLFMNTNGWANLRLRTNSPCLNAGNNSYANGSTDLDGNPRILLGKVDMGAYESHGPYHYVNASNPNSAPPYTSWDTAANNIQDAIDAAIDGDEVLVYKGTYATGGRAVVGTMTNRVVIDKPVTVRSFSSPSLTRILGQGVGPEGTNNGDGAIRCVYLGPGAVLSGFTLANGHTRTNGDTYQEYCGGGALCEATAVLSNCTLTANSAKSGGGAYGGMLNNCNLNRNWANGGGGASFSALNNCIVSANSAITSGGGAYNSTLKNCTITGNSSAQYGGGAAVSRVTNSIVYYNTAPTMPNSYACSSAYSCTMPRPISGTGNITNAPLFLDTNDWGNLRLQPISPCINAGENIYVTLPSDLDNNPRISDNKVDMGAYEFQGPPLSGFGLWLWQYGLPTDGSGDYIDSDGDGLNNYQEWRAGTDPTNAGSVLRLTAQTSGSSVQLQWQGVIGINYYLQRSTNLSANPPFQILSTNISGTAGPMTYIDTNPPAQTPLFYRLGVPE